MSLHLATENILALQWLRGSGEQSPTLAAPFLESCCAVTRSQASFAAAVTMTSAWPSSSLCRGSGGGWPQHRLAVDSPSQGAHPQNAPGPLMILISETPALGGQAIKPNKVQGAPWGAHRDAHSNWPQASGSPRGYGLCSGSKKGYGRVRTLKEAR